MKKRNTKRAYIPERKFRALLKLFSQDLTAVQTSNLTSLHRNTVNRYLMLFRYVIATHCDHKSPFQDEIEVGKSFFGARRTKDKRGCGAHGKTIFFSMYKFNGKVYQK